MKTSQRKQNSKPDVCRARFSAGMHLSNSIDFKRFLWDKLVKDAWEIDTQITIVQVLIWNYTIFLWSFVRYYF